MPNGQIWREPTLIAVFMDNSDWELIDLGRGEAPPSFSLHFHNVEIRRESDNKPVGGNQKKNYSFFNAKNVSIGDDLLSENRGRRFLSFENHFNETGIKGKRRKKDANAGFYDHYKFDIFYKVNYGSGEDDNLLVIVDPGGRNMGP